MVPPHGYTHGYIVYIGGSQQAPQGFKLYSPSTILDNHIATFLYLEETLFIWVEHVSWG